jgi:hypothetical protein
MRRRCWNRTGPWPGWCSAQPGRRSALVPARPTPPRAMTPPATLLATSPARRASRSVPRAPAAGLAALAPRGGGTRLPAWSMAGTAPSAARRVCRWLSHPAQSHPNAAQSSVHADPMRPHAAQADPGMVRSSAQVALMRLPAGQWRLHLVRVRHRPAGACLDATRSSRQMIGSSAPNAVRASPHAWLGHPAARRPVYGRWLGWSCARLGRSSPPGEA